MGGTFDPIHLGHLAAASEAAHECGLDEVVFVPAGRPWQKQHRIVSDPQDRYVMTVLATVDDPRFSVSRVDIERPGSTYTVDTLRDLQQHNGPETDLYLILGADALAGLHSWHEPERIMSLARLVGVTRPGHLLPDAALVPPGTIILSVPGVDVSATEIRERVASGRPVDYLLPPGVASYVAKRRLYSQP